MKAKEIALRSITLISYEILLTALAFAVPFLVSGPQILTGSLVNLFLLLSATRFSGKNKVLIAIAPSIGALLHGMVFGGFTIYLAYFLPFIWIGNLILMESFRSLEKKSWFTRILLPSLAKSSLLFLSALFFFGIGLVPKMFLTAMGVFQLATAILGGAAFYAIRPMIKKQ